MDVIEAGMLVKQEHMEQILKESRMLFLIKSCLMGSRQRLKLSSRKLKSTR